MKKENRIKKSQEFQSILSKRQSKSSKTFVVYHNPKQQNEARVGISVSKKLGNAVIRNKSKRQIREMVHDLVDLKVCEKDFIIIARNAFVHQDFQTNKKDLERVLKHCKIL